MAERELFTLHYITLHYITLHYITLHYYWYGFTLVFCNLHCIYIIYFRLVGYISTCTVHTQGNSANFIRTEGAIFSIEMELSTRLDRGLWGYMQL